MTTRTLYECGMPVFGKNHSNPCMRTLAGLAGFFTQSGHLIDRAWGSEGSALCGATVRFAEDPLTRTRGLLARCCEARYDRIARRLGRGGGTR